MTWWSKYVSWCRCILECEQAVSTLSEWPDAWKDGEVKGLCAKGNFELDIRWKNGSLSSVTVLSKDGGNCELRYKDDKFVLKTVKSKTYTLNYINGKFVPING